MANIKETLNGSKHFIPEHPKAGFSTTAILAIALGWLGTNGLTENVIADAPSNETSIAQQSKEKVMTIPPPNLQKKQGKKTRIPPPRVTSRPTEVKPPTDTIQEITHEIIYTGPGNIILYKNIKVEDSDIVIVFGNTAQSGKNRNGGNYERGVLATLSEGTHNVRIEQGGYEIYHNVPKGNLDAFKKEVLKARLTQQSNDHGVRVKGHSEVPEWSPKPTPTSPPKSSPQ